jgi:prepilin-type N-terminal cleavage/methylation domain-containing protein
MKTLQRERGFTLVELVVAMVILTIGLLGLASSMATLTRWQALSASRAEMSLLADGKLEQLRGAASVMSAGISELAIGGSVDTGAEPWTDNVVGPNGRQYVLLWSVAAGPGTTRNVQLRIKPVVDAPTTPKKIDFNTLIVFRD